MHHEQKTGAVKDLAGAVAIVTGASRRIGIGAATCRALAARGADVFFTHWGAYDTLVLSGRDEAGPADLLQELIAMGVRAAEMEADLSDPGLAAAILAAATEQLGPPRILIYNATHSTRDGYEQLDAATLDAHYAVNLRGTMLLSVLFARAYTGGEGGRIICLTSGQDLGPMPGELAYAATKAGIVAFARSLSADVAAKGITVNAVNPGPTDTGWMDDDLKEKILREAPFGRIGMPDDAARLIAGGQPGRGLDHRAGHQFGRWIFPWVPITNNPIRSAVEQAGAARW